MKQTEKTYTLKEVDKLVDEINKKHKKLQKIKHDQPELRKGFRFCLGGVVNAYREGDNFSDITPLGAYVDGDRSFMESKQLLKEIVCLELGLCTEEHFPTLNHLKDMVYKDSVNYIVGAFIKGLITKIELNEMLVAR